MTDTRPRNLFSAFAASAMLLCGCEEGRQRYFKGRLIRPDGVVHREFSGTRSYWPPLHDRGGTTWVNLDNDSVFAPVGWLIEIEEEAERE